QEWKRKVEKEPHPMDEMEENEERSVRFATRQQLIEVTVTEDRGYSREPHQYQQEWKRKVEKEPHPMDEIYENERTSVRFATRQQLIEVTVTEDRGYSREPHQYQQEWKRKVEKEPHPMDEIYENERTSVRFATRQQLIEVTVTEDRGYSREPHQYQQEWKWKVEKEPHPMDEIYENERTSVRFATRQQLIEVTVTEDRGYSREPHQYQQEWKRKVEKEPHPMNEIYENERTSVRFATRQQLIEVTVTEDRGYSREPHQYQQEWKREVEKEPHPMDEIYENERTSVRFATRQQLIEVTVTEDRGYSREPHQYQQEWKRKVEKEPHPMDEIYENERTSVRFATRQQLIE
ncbi:hypothetical protein PRIPAC_92457, partial [Pristionchus pacificus]|uniref:Uncharacterized protein n=1 Tax=Pristionchus pacificus TaxID=54126 RepID=A0A2A6BRG4_PRIPA